MTSNSSKRAAGIGAAVGIAGATAVTLLAVNHGGSTTSGAPIQPVAPQVAVASSSPQVLHPMPHPHVLESHRQQAVSPQIGPARWLSPARIRSIAAKVGGGRVEDVGPGEIPGRPTYDVSVVRADGSDVTVLIDARNGAVLATDGSGQDPANPPDPQSPPNADGTGGD